MVVHVLRNASWTLIGSATSASCTSQTFDLKITNLKLGVISIYIVHPIDPYRTGISGFHSLPEMVVMFRND